MTSSTLIHCLFLPHLPRRGSQLFSFSTLISDPLIEAIDLYTETPDIIILPPSAHHEIISTVNNVWDVGIAASLASLAALITVCSNVYRIISLLILSCSPTQPFIGPTFNMMLFKMSPLRSPSLFGSKLHLFFADTCIGLLLLSYSLSIVCPHFIP